MMWKDANDFQEAAKHALILAAAGGFVIGFVLWSAGAGFRAALLLGAVPLVRFLWVSGKIGGRKR